MLYSYNLYNADRKKNVTYSAGIMHQLKMSFRAFLPNFWFQEVSGFAQMVVVQGSLEGSIGGLREHTLLLQNGEDTHGLQERKKSQL